MKLSSAFDETALLQGCSGKTEPVASEVAASTGINMSYLDKANAMRLIESSESVPVKSFNGIFSLSDESGVNTIAYGEAGTIYGCFNYSNKNVASYSKTYSGTPIIASAYAVAKADSEEGVEGDASHPESSADDFNSQKGIMIGISQNGIYAYWEDETKSTWLPVSFLNAGIETSNIDVFGVFAVGRMFFITCRPEALGGILAFNANAVNIEETSASVSRAIFLVPPNQIRTNTNNCQSISSIKKLNFTIGSTDVESYAMIYGRYIGLFSDVSSTCHWIELNVNENDERRLESISDVVSISNASFPELASAKYPQISTKPKEIDMIESRALSIRTMAGLDSKWTDIASAAETVSSLKVKTEQGYAVLARITSEADIENLNSPNAEESDRNVRRLFIFNTAQTAQGEQDQWIKFVPWDILDASEPDPCHLVEEKIYRVEASPSGGTGGFHSRWHEDYAIKKIEGAHDVDLQEIPADSIELPADAVQLFNSGTEDQPSELELILDIQEVVDSASSPSGEGNTVARTVSNGWVCFKCPSNEFTATNVTTVTIYINVADKTDWIWTGGHWEMVNREDIDLSLQTINDGGYIYIERNAGSVTAFKPVKIDMSSSQEPSILISRQFGMYVLPDGTETFKLKASASAGIIEHEEGSLEPDRQCIKVNLSLNDIVNIPWFDFDVEFKTILEIEETEFELDEENNQLVPKNSTLFVEIPKMKHSDSQLWIADSSALEGSELQSQRVLYSQTGIFSMNNLGEYIGNHISCSLSIRNSGTNWQYSISPKDAELLSILTGDGIQSGIEVYIPYTFTKLDGTESSTHLLAGTMYLSRDGILCLEKKSADSLRNADSIPGTTNCNNPEMKAEGEYVPFNGMLNWKLLDKESETESILLSGTLSVSLNGVVISDAANYTGKWNEYFENIAYLPAESNEMYCLLHSKDEVRNAYVYTLQDIENGSKLHPYQLIEANEKNLERYVFAQSDGYGCYTDIGFTNSNMPSISASSAFRQIASSAGTSAEASGRKYIRLLAPSCMWTVPVKEKETYASIEDVFSAGSCIQCFNFHIAADGAESDETFVRFIETDSVNGIGTRTEYSARIYPPAAENEQPRMVVTFKVNNAAATADAPDPSVFDAAMPYRSFDVLPSTPVWINGRIYMLDMNNAAQTPGFVPAVDEYNHPLESSTDYPLVSLEELELNASAHGDICLWMHPSFEFAVNETTEKLEMKFKCGRYEDFTDLSKQIAVDTEGNTETEILVFDRQYGSPVKIQRQWNEETVRWMPAAAVLFEEEVPIDIFPQTISIANESSYQAEWVYAKNGTYSLVHFKPASNHLMAMDGPFELIQASLEVPVPQTGIAESLDKASLSDAVSRKAAAVYENESGNPVVKLISATEKEKEDDGSSSVPAVAASLVVQAAVARYSVPQYTTDENGNPVPQLDDYGQPVEQEMLRIDWSMRQLEGDEALDDIPVKTGEAMLMDGEELLADIYPVLAVKATDAGADGCRTGIRMFASTEVAGLNAILEWHFGILRSEEGAVVPVYSANGNALENFAVFETPSVPAFDEMMESSYADAPVEAFFYKDSARSIAEAIKAAEGKETFASDMVNIFDGNVANGTVLENSSVTHEMQELGSDAVECLVRYLAGGSDSVETEHSGGIDVTFVPVSGTISSIPHVQYDQLKQWEYADLQNGERSFLVKTNKSGGWTLQEEEALENGTHVWKPWNESKYNGEKIIAVSNASEWPVFTPQPGKIYYVNTDNRTAEDVRWTHGYYVYNGDAGSIAASYSKLPAFDASSSEEDHYWRSWLNNLSLTYLMAIGTAGGDSSSSTAAGKEYAVQIVLSDNGWIVPAANAQWIDAGSFIKSSGKEPLVPAQGASFSSVIDESSRSRNLAFCITIGTGSNAQYLYKQVSSDFSIPRIAGLFQTRTESGRPFIGITRTLDLFGSEQGGSVNVDEAHLPTSGPAETAVIRSMAIRPDSSKNLKWIWEAATIPFQTTVNGLKSYLIGLYGEASVSGTSRAQAYCEPVYADAPKTEMWLIKSPEPDAAQGSEDEALVFYNNQGFHVKTVVHLYEEEDVLPSEMNGTDAIASQRAIIDMTVVKAYNVPIIMGLYETGGIILFYGHKCFNDSILQESRLKALSNAGSIKDSEGNELNTALERSDKLKAALEFSSAGNIYTPSQIEEYESLQFKAKDILDLWLPSGTALSSLVQSFEESANESLDADARQVAVERLEWLAGREEFSPGNLEDESAEKAVASICQSIVNKCIETEAKEETLAEFDHEFLMSCDYSPNNSEESQWIDIPIYIKEKRIENGNEIEEIVEPSEKLTTLRTSIVNGRIRVSVGSSKGAVYQRDLNPLHADRYISFIPVPYLSEQEQAGIKKDLEPLAEDDYERIGIGRMHQIVRPSFRNLPQDEYKLKMLKIGWTTQEWRLKNKTVADQNRFLAKANSRVSIEDGEGLWLYDRSKDLNCHLADGDYRIAKIQNGEYMPYVRERAWYWTIGSKRTSIKAYANIPYVAKNENGVLQWFVPSLQEDVDAISTGVAASRSIYPEISEFNGVRCWKLGDKIAFLGTEEDPQGIEVKFNGVPYIEDGKWMIQQHGKAKPTSFGIYADPGAMLAATVSDPIDLWYIDPLEEGGNPVYLKYSTTVSNFKKVSFKLVKRRYWTLHNVHQILDIGAMAAGEDSDAFMTDVVVNDGETVSSSPYVLTTINRVVLDDKNEDPVWKSNTKENISLARNGGLFINKIEIAGSEPKMQKCYIASAKLAAEIILHEETEPVPVSSSSKREPYWIGKSGKTLWLPPSSVFNNDPNDTVYDAYTDSFEAVSSIGTKWTSTSILAKNGKKTTIEWELIGISGADGGKFVPLSVQGTDVWTVNGKYLRYIADENSSRLTGVLTVKPDDPVPDPANSNAFLNAPLCAVDDWLKPKLPAKNADIWQWRLQNADGTFKSEYDITTTTSKCPYSKIQEICVWKDGNIVSGVSTNLESATLVVKAVENKDGPVLHWRAVGNSWKPVTASEDNPFIWTADIVKASEGQPEINVVPVWNGTECIFKWQVYGGKNRGGDNVKWIDAVTTKSALQCPLVKTAKEDWFVYNKISGKFIDTGVEFSYPVAGKGLERDGIAEIYASNTQRNHFEKTWVPGGCKGGVYTPLASIFVDTYHEIADGILGSTTTPYYKKEGMLWNVIPASEIFSGGKSGQSGGQGGTGGDFGIDEEYSVYISASENNSWLQYKEGANGNSIGISFTAYAGWQIVPNSNLYNNYLTLISDSTGTSFQWKQLSKEWRFDYIKFICDGEGMLQKIVILCSQGWIISSDIITYESNGKDIKAIRWRDPVNPVKKVLKNLNKLMSFKWISWASNQYGEFAAVGTSGIYVYSEDCILFEASQPYGEDAEMLEVIWVEPPGEFTIRAVAPTTNKSDEDEEDDGGRGYIDFEIEHSLNPSNPNSSEKELSVSLLSGEEIYTHMHKNFNGKLETKWYRFSPMLSYFEEIYDDDEILTASARANATTIIPDNEYKWFSGGNTWNWVYTKRTEASGKPLGAGYTGKEKWIWNWGSADPSVKTSGSLSYITISKNKKSVAYGFPDLIRFIKSYKNLYTDSMEFLGEVSTYISSEREAVDPDGKALIVSLKELSEMGDAGIGMYSDKLPTAYQIYLQAKTLRDNSHYAKDDCWDTYLQKIAQSIALEKKNFFNKAKQAMWTAQAFRNYYEDLAKKGGG